MYNVSDYYLDAISQESTSWCIKVNVKLSRDSDTLVVLDGTEDFLSETIKLSSQATSGSNFTIGGVCSSELSMSLSSSGVVKLKQRNLLRKYICFDVNIWILTDDNNQDKLDYSLNVDGTENTTGKCHLGYFYIYTVKNSDYLCQLTLYDAMIAFARDLTQQDQINVQQGYRSIVDYLSLFCASCQTDYIKLGVVGGLADRIANSEDTFTIDRDQTMDSYRNAIGYLSILAGGFAVITRDGLLDIVSFTNTNDYHVPHQRVMSYEMSEETYTIDTISTIVAGFNYDSKTTEYIGIETIPIYLSENPFLRGRQQVDETNLSDIVKLEIDNITSHVTGLKFRGGSFEISGHPEFDLGDCISFTKIYVSNIDGKNEIVESIYDNVLICKHNWSFQGFSELVCNDYGDQSSKDSKKLQSSFKTSSSGGGGTAKVQNSIEKLVGTSDVHLEGLLPIKLFDALFALEGGIGAQFSVTVTANVIEAGNITFNMVYDSEPYFYHPKYTSQVGYETYSFTCYLEPIENDLQHQLIIEIESDGIVLDILAFDYQLIVNASGVTSSSGVWTGRFEVTDYVSKLKHNLIGFSSAITDEVSVSFEAE